MLNEGESIKNTLEMGEGSRTHEIIKTNEHDHIIFSYHHRNEDKDEGEDDEKKN